MHAQYSSQGLVGWGICTGEQVTRGLLHPTISRAILAAVLALEQVLDM